MKVLIVHPRFYIYGGAELLIVRLANYLTRKGIRNAILTTAISPEVEKDLIDTDIIVSKKEFFNSFQIGEALSLYRGMQSIFRSFDVINVHNYPAELSVFSYRKPVVWMCNEPPEISLGMTHEKSLIKKIVIRIILSLDKFIVRHYVKSVIVADEFNHSRFKKSYGLEPAVINYGIDYDFFSQGDKEKVIEKFDLYDNFIISQVGMLTPLKNQIESLKTIEKLRCNIPNIKLILAGWGEKVYVSRVKKYIKDKDLDNYVIITGYLNREFIRDIYRASHVLLHPIKSQGGWLTPFEALCAGIPIVVSKEMTAFSIIEQEKIGVVTDDYIGSILDIYKNPNEYHEMVIRGRNWVRENLNWDKFCEKMVKIFLCVSKGV